MLASFRRLIAPRTAIAAASVMLFCALASTDAEGRRRKPSDVVSISLETSADAIEVGDSFQLDVVVRAATAKPIDELSLPDLSDFRVLRDHRSTMKSRKRSGGRSFVQTEYRYTYLLTADRAGRKRIGGARVRVGQEIATHRAVPILVKASTRTPLPRDERGDPTAKPGENLPPYFLDVSFNKNEAYVGEGVTLTARLYAQTTVSGRALDTPQWKQFWVEELSGAGSRPVQRDIEGKRYYIYTVSKKALFPLEAGELVIPPMSMQVETGSGLFGRGRSMVLRSDPAVLNAKALPAKGQPRTFTLGNVGEWKLEANITPRRLRVGEAATLRLTATGVGNVGQLTMPALDQEIEGARLFPPSFNERKTVDAGQVVGVKVVDALVQPTKTGVIEIPAYTLEYFDPKEKAYKRSTTKAMRLKVSRAKNDTAQSGAQSGPSKKEIAAGARPVHLGVTSGGDAIGIWPAPLGILLGFLAWLSMAIMGRRREESASDQGAQRSKRAKARRKAMADAHQEKDLGRARSLVMDALADRVGDHVRALPHDELIEACQGAGLASDRASAVAAFFEAVDAVRFTPDASRSRQQLFEEGARLQEALDAEGGQ